MATQVQERTMHSTSREPAAIDDDGPLFVYDVVIAARDEEQNIGRVLSAFADYGEQEHLYEIGTVHVVIDDATADDTEEMARATPMGAKLHIVRTAGVKGKGQCVSSVLGMVREPYVMFCDADWRGLTAEHITAVAKECIERGTRVMTIGVPAYPRGVPAHVINSWPFVSGFRMVPTFLARHAAPLTGYLMETQLNITAQRVRMGIMQVHCHDAVSPFEWPLPEWRRFELERDREWGIRNGWLSPGVQRPRLIRNYPEGNSL